MNECHYFSKLSWLRSGLFLLIFLFPGCRDNSPNHTPDTEVTPLEMALIAELQNSRGPVYSLDWSLTGDSLITSGFEEWSLWNMTSMTRTSTFAENSSYVWGVSWSSGNAESLAAIASKGGTIRVWNLRSGQLNFLVNPGWTFCVDWSSDGRYLAYGTSDGSVAVYDANLMNQVFSCELNRAGSFPERAIICLEWSPDDAVIAAGCWYGGTLLINFSQKKIIDVLESGTTNRDDVNGLDWSPNGKILATAHQDGYLRFWNVEKSALSTAIKAHDGWARGTSWSPDGACIASAGGDRQVNIWDYKTRKNRSCLTDPAQPVWSLDWSPDGTRLAAGSGIYDAPEPGGKIYIWEKAE